MSFGTIVHKENNKDKIYNLDNMSLEELKKLDEEVRNEFSPEKVKDLVSKDDGTDKLEDFFTKSSVIKMAYYAKMSGEIVSQKVNAKLLSIKHEISSVNPRCVEGTKNYEVVKESIVNVLSKYRKALDEASSYYDAKIEEKFVEKIYCATKLVEAYKDLANDNKSKVSKNAILDKAKENYVEIVKKLSYFKQKKEPINPRLVEKLQDNSDVCNDEKRKEKGYIKGKINQILSEMKHIDVEIKEIEGDKEKLLQSAMENGNGALSTKISRTPKLLKKIGTFFTGRFNSLKIIIGKIVTPIEKTISKFENTELKGKNGIGISNNIQERFESAFKNNLNLQANDKVEKNNQKTDEMER